MVWKHAPVVCCCANHAPQISGADLLCNAQPQERVASHVGCPATHPPPLPKRAPWELNPSPGMSSTSKGAGADKAAGQAGDRQGCESSEV